MVKRSNTLKMVKQATGSLPSRSAKGKPNCQVTYKVFLFVVGLLLGSTANPWRKCTCIEFTAFFLVSNHSCSTSFKEEHADVPLGSPTPKKKGNIWFVMCASSSSQWLRSDEELRLIDVTPLSLGLQTAGGFMTTVLFPLLQGLGWVGF